MAETPAPPGSARTTARPSSPYGEPPPPPAASPEASPGDFRRYAALIAFGILSTTLAQPAVLGSLPIKFLLKNQLHIRPEAMAGFFAAAALAWYFKPFAGILTDSFPLFGTRRKHYLLISSALCGALWLLLDIVPTTYAALLWTCIALNVAMMFASTVVGGLLVEEGQRFAATGRLSSVRSSVQNLAVLIAGPLGGLLARQAFGWTTAIAACLVFALVPLTLGLLREPPVVRRNTEAWSAAWQQIKTIVASRTLWAAVLLLFLVYISPGFGTPLFYYQTNQLKFGSQFIGKLGLISGALGIGGAFVYGISCRRLPLRPLLVIGITLNVLGSLCYLFYHSAAAAIAIEGMNGFFVTWAELPLLDLAARATPRGSESMGYALFLSVRNGALALSDIFGSWLFDHYHLQFFNLVWLNAGTTALVLLFVPFLPRVLMNRRDGETAA